MEVLVDARWIDAPGICATLVELAALTRSDGFRPALTARCSPSARWMGA
jgi:hypothetical protein